MARFHLNMIESLLKSGDPNSACTHAWSLAQFPQYKDGAERITSLIHSMSSWDDDLRALVWKEIDDEFINNFFALVRLIDELRSKVERQGV